MVLHHFRESKGRLYLRNEISGKSAGMLSEARSCLAPGGAALAETGGFPDELHAGGMQIKAPKQPIIEEIV